MTDALTPEAEAVRICRDLIRIDSSNYGDGSGPGERACAEYVMGELTEVGLDPLYVESAPGRANILVRIEGADRSRPGLAVHGHLDVVPANADDWRVDPFAAEVRDDCIWGRGAIDMKDMDAMILANVRRLARAGGHWPGSWRPCPSWRSHLAPRRSRPGPRPQRDPLARHRRWPARRRGVHERPGPGDFDPPPRCGRGYWRGPGRSRHTGGRARPR